MRRRRNDGKTAAHRAALGTFVRSPRGQPRPTDRAKRAESLTSSPARNPTLFRGVPPGYCRSVSRSLEPSLQSSLQLSLTVLVRYRSGGIIFSLGWSLPPVLRLHSQAIRLCSYARYQPVRRPRFGSATFYGTRTGLSPSRGNRATVTQTSASRGTVALVWTDETHRITPHCPALNGRGFSVGLFPVHSQLLGESSLVSFPPPTDMLKFSG